MCLWTWPRDGYPWESWWQVLTSIIRVGCNIKEKPWIFKNTFESVSDWRAIWLGMEEDSYRSEAQHLVCSRLLCQSARQHLSSLVDPTAPCPSSSKPRDKGIEREWMPKGKNIRKQDRNLENTKVNSHKGLWKECLDFKILKPRNRKNPNTEYLLLKWKTISAQHYSQRYARNR